MGFEIFYFSQFQPIYLAKKSNWATEFFRFGNPSEPSCGCYPTTNDYVFCEEWSKRIVNARVNYLVKYTCKSDIDIDENIDDCFYIPAEIAEHAAFKTCKSDWCIVFGDKNSISGVASSGDDVFSLFSTCFNAVYSGASLNFSNIQVVPPKLKDSGYIIAFLVKNKLGKIYIECLDQYHVDPYSWQADYLTEEKAKAEPFVITEWKFRD